MSFAGKWMKQKIILLSENQTQKNKHHMFSSYAESRPKKLRALL
jgi:hypothetical protein